MLTFFSYVVFSPSPSPSCSPPHSRSPSPSPSPQPCCLPSASMLSPLSHHVVLLLLSLVFLCISCGAISYWFSFASLLFIGFARVQVTPFLASSTFVWYAQASWWSRLNAWFDTPCLFYLQEVNNFLKLIKNSYKFIFDPNFLSAS